jgi:uncharacterized protein (DUF1697 family)
VVIMPVYVALLRGINILGYKRIKMDALRKSFEALGFDQVKTYIQSGNVVFKAAKTSPTALCSKIEKRIVSDFGFSSLVISRTQDEMRDAIQKNPFLKETGADPDKFHVTFLSEVPAAAALRKLEAMVLAPDQLRCVGKDVYLYMPNGVGKSKLMKASWERVLSVSTTSRNWRTVNTLHQMCQDCG